MSERADHADHASRYVMPTSGTGRAMLGFFNSVVAGLTKAGISVMGSRVLYVRGRTSGQWRTTPVNLLRHEGKSYLVAPRGHTQWVKNMRVAGGGELHVGRRVEKFTATELADADKPADPARLPAPLEGGGRRVLRWRGPGRHGRRAARHRARLPGLPPGHQLAAALATALATAWQRTWWGEGSPASSRSRSAVRSSAGV